MARENWVDHVLNRAKDAPIIGRAAGYVADRRETARQEDAFWNVVDVSISNHEHDRYMKEWRTAMPQPQNIEVAREIRLSTSPIVTQAERDAARDRFTGVVADQQQVVQQQRQQEQARHEGLER